MNRLLFIGSLLLGMAAHGQAAKAAIAPLVESSCIDCHDADTDTPLDFVELGHDLADMATFRQWVKVFERVQRGEMPPLKDWFDSSPSIAGDQLFLRGHRFLYCIGK